MKILIIDNSIGVTGALNSIIDKITDFDSDYEFIFLIPKGSKSKDKIEKRGFKCIEINFIEISKNMFNNFLYFPQLIVNAYRISKIVNKHKIDLIHVNDIYNLSGIFTKFFKKIKVITHIRRMPESFPLFIYYFWVKIHLRYSDKIIAVSNANAKIFNNSPKVEVLYNSTILSQQENDFSENEVLTIMYLANYTYGKGQNHALKVLKEISALKLNQKYKVRFVGSTFDLKNNIEFKKELKRKVYKYQMENFVFIEDESKDIYSDLTNSDIVLNFSDSESLSKVTMESLFYRIPIIATDVGGTNEMIQDGFNGFLVKKDDFEDMQNKLVTLINDKGLRQKFFKNNENYIKSKFSKEVITKKLFNIYDFFNKNSARKKIIIIDNSIGLTGALKAITKITNSLSEEYNFIYFIPKRSTSSIELKKYNFIYFEMKFIEISRNFFKNCLYPFQLLVNSYKLSKFVYDNDVKVVHVNDIYNMLGISLKFFCNVKVIYQIRRMPESFPKFIYTLWRNLISKFSNIILPVSHANAKAFKTINSKIRVLYDPGVQDERRVDYESRNQSNCLQLLYLSNYTKGKGQEYALQVVKRILDEGCFVNLKYVGSDFNHKPNIEFKQSLISTCNSLGMNNYVTFCEFTDSIFEEFNNSDIVLNFSDSESLSRVTMEALHFGLPIIATDVGGTNEMIIQDYNGLLVERGNLDDMYDALMTLVNDREKRLKFHRNNIGYIREKFDTEKISKELKETYNLLIVK